MSAVGARRARMLSAIADAGSGTEASAVTAACHACADGLDVDGASIAITAGSDSPGLVGASDQVGFQLEELQFSLREGPCIDALSSLRVIDVDDLSRNGSDRWPIFAPAAAQAGVVGLAAAPLQIGAIVLGSLDLYRVIPGPLKGVNDVLLAAEAVAFALLESHNRTQDVAGPARPSHQPSDAWMGHREIHQATGMVTAQLEVSASAALARLRAHAFGNDRPLIDVCRDIVSRKLSFTDRDKA